MIIFQLGQGGEQMFRARKTILVLVAAFLVLSSFSMLQAAVTGKITGVVFDKRTNEALPSVAIQIVGTTKGALSGPDGDFVIMNVPPGTYSVTFRLVGYQTYQVDGVIVVTDRSVDVTAEMSSSSVESDLVQIVKAKKDIMEMNKPSSNVVISKDQMEVMPVQNVDEILAASVGVVRRYGELHIRGGRSGEVSYVVDGVETKDPLGGLGPTDAGMNLSSNSIEEIQIIKGGFDAEYGRAMSGIVTINTKTGTSTTEGYAQFLTDNFRAPNLNKYSNNYDKIYFSIGGPEPFLAGRALTALGVDYFRDKLFYFFSIDTYKSDGDVSYKEYSSPSTQRDWRTRDFLGIDVADRQYNSFSLTAKLTYRVTNNINAVFNYQGIWDDRTVFNWAYRYTPETAPIGNDLNQRYSMTFTHQVNKSTFYELLVSRVYHEYVQKPDDPSNPGVGLTPDAYAYSDQWESFRDRNGNGVYDAPEPFVNVYHDTSYEFGGSMYNLGDVFMPDTLVATVFGWDTEQPYGLYDPWWADSIRWQYEIFTGTGMGSNPEDFRLTYVDSMLLDWNGDNLVSFEEGEPFVDINNNGRWDRGDEVRNDQNGNNRYDPELGRVVAQDVAEPYIDGDINLGEPFHDLNNDGVYEKGIDLFVRTTDDRFNQDLNHNSKYDGPGDSWTPKIPFKDLNNNGIYDAPNNRYDVGESYVDLNGNGKWDGSDGFLDYGYHEGVVSGGTENPHYNESSSEVWTVNFKITKQLVREHELKTGFELRFLDLKFAQITDPWIRADETALRDGGPWPTRGAVRDFYDHDPTEGAFFIQDVIEYGSLVARAGLRYDFFFQSSTVDTLVEYYEEAGENVIDSRGKLSPRVGISYPITEKAKIYFNYGHFYQLPQYTNMYRRLGQETGTIGNPNLDYQKTVQYEFGVRYNLSGDYVLDISGFYKDIFGIINTQKVRFGFELYEFTNNDYGRTRGFEVQLDKKYGDYISGYVNYTYSFAYGKASSETSNYEALVENREIPIQEFPLDWDVRHMITVNLDLRITKSDHPKLFGYSIPNDWGVNVLWQWNSGYPYTPGSDHPGLTLMPGERVLTNSLRLPSSSNVDIRFDKNFSLFNIDYSFNLWIDNVFDNQNVSTVYANTGRWDTSNNVNGIVRGGNEYDSVPWYVDPGRNIRFGISMNF